MAAAAEQLNAKYDGNPTVFRHVPAYYNHDEVRQYVQEELEIPEEMGVQREQRLQ